MFAFVHSGVLDQDCKTVLAGWTGNTKTTHHVYTHMMAKKMDLKSMFAHKEVEGRYRRSKQELK